MDNRIDLLNREGFIENVIKLVNQLSENKKGCCFAIEGGWGIGKTFVIERVEEQLKLVQSEKTYNDRYFVFHYNCWQYDYYEEPAVAIVSAMIASVQKEDIFINKDIDSIKKAANDLLKEKLSEIAGTFIESKIGVNLISIAEEINNEKNRKEKSSYEFDKLFNFNQTIEKTRKKLQEIAKERTIVFIVDELDRCIPEYAIKVLERLHHIFFGLENIVVIMAIDKKQLEHSVEEMFGTKNDSGSMNVEKYLKKFIDFSVVLDNGKINDTLREKYDFYFNRFMLEDDIEKVNRILSIVLEEIDIRRQEKIIEKANLVHSIVCCNMVDISVLVFEVMYEVLRLNNVPKSFYVSEIEKKYYVPLNMDAYQVVNGLNFNHQKIEYKAVNSNLYGRTLWYFLKSTNSEEGYKDLHQKMQDFQTEIEVAKKYCKFCEMIK